MNNKVEKLKKQVLFNSEKKRHYENKIHSACRELQDCVRPIVGELCAEFDFQGITIENPIGVMDFRGGCYVADWSPSIYIGTYIDVHGEEHWLHQEEGKVELRTALEKLAVAIEDAVGIPCSVAGFDKELKQIRESIDRGDYDDID
jgi:hypothetical protein